MSVEDEDTGDKGVEAAAEWLRQFTAEQRWAMAELLGVIAYEEQRWDMDDVNQALSVVGDEDETPYRPKVWPS